jgi:hypothetical protein
VFDVSLRELLAGTTPILPDLSKALEIPVDVLAAR